MDIFADMPVLSPHYEEEQQSEIIIEEFSNKKNVLIETPKKPGKVYFNLSKFHQNKL